jgi:hypothetical protein
MVKSNVRDMPKRRKIEVDPELLKELEDLRRRMQETDRRIEATMARAEEARRKLRLIDAHR